LQNNLNFKNGILYRVHSKKYFLNLGELCLVLLQINVKKTLFYVLLFNIMNLFEPGILIILNY